MPQYQNTIMKKTSIRFFFIALLILVTLFISGILANSSGFSFSGNTHIETGLSQPDENPIGDVIGILLVLSISFGCFKIFKVWKNESEDKV